MGSGLSFIIYECAPGYTPWASVSVFIMSRKSEKISMKWTLCLCILVCHLLRGSRTFSVSSNWTPSSGPAQLLKPALLGPLF